MMRAHRIRLHPTATQATYFARAAGTARFVWNWALEEDRSSKWGAFFPRRRRAIAVDGNGRT